MKGAQNLASQLEHKVQQACRQRPYQVAAAGIAVAAGLVLVQHGRGGRRSTSTPCRRQ